MAESKYPMIPVEEAVGRILEKVSPLPPVELPFMAAQGLVLAEDIRATEPMPPFPASAKDGFAVIAGDRSPTRRIVGDQFAGHKTDLRVVPGTAARITTGAPLPPGADAIVMVEFTEVRDGEVTIRTQVEPGADVRPTGQDIETGQIVLPAGTRLGPAELGLLATVGRTRVRVHPRPRVGVMSTGDEIVEPDQQPGPGQFRDSNRFSLMAAVVGAGGEPVDLGLAPDTREALEAFIRRGLSTNDAVLTSGGVSMGELDLLKPLLEELGEVHFGRVCTKPGKPVTFATVQSKPFFAMPGFPVSSLVSFEIFVRPALRRMAGDPVVLRSRLPVVLDHTVRHTADRTEFQRAIIRYDWNDGRFHARTTGFQGSGRLLSMVGANALIELPYGQGDFEVGQIVEAVILSSRWPEGRIAEREDTKQEEGRQTPGLPPQAGGS